MPATAGAGWNDFTAGNVLTAAQVDSYLMAQSIMRFASAAARDAVLTGANAPTEGMHCTLDDTDKTYRYTGASWAEVGGLSASLFTAKGSLLSATASETPAEVVAGTDFHRLRARAGATAGIEWAAVGAAAEVATQQTTTSTSMTDLGTVGPAVTITTGTEVWVFLAGLLSVTGGAARAFMGVAVSGATTLAAATTNAYTVYFGDPAYGEVNAGRWIRLTGLTPGSNTFTAKYSTSVNTASFGSRLLIAEPV